jgi:hypothetical protein
MTDPLLPVRDALRQGVEISITTPQEPEGRLSTAIETNMANCNEPRSLSCNPRELWPVSLVPQAGWYGARCLWHSPVTDMRVEPQRQRHSGRLDQLNLAYPRIPASDGYQYDRACR